MSGVILPEPSPAETVETLQQPAPASWLGVLSASRLGQFGYSLADQVFAVGGMFVVNIALARARSKEEYGIFALSYSIFTFLSGLHNAAILEAYTVHGSGRYHRRFTGYGRLLWRSNAWLLAGLSAFLLVAWQSLRWLHPAFASPALLGMAMTCGVLLTAAFVRRTFYIRRRPDLAVRFSAAFFVSCMILLALAIRQDLLNGLSAFLIVALAWAIAGLFILHEHPGRAGSDEAADFLPQEPEYWSEHWKYSRWVFVTALVFQFTTQAYFWVVAGFLSVRNVAELRALYNLALPVDQIFAAITLLVLPQMALQFAAHDFEKLRHLWRQCSLMFLGISSVFALVVGVGSLRLLHIVYGGKFDSVSPLLRWYVLLPVVMGLGNAANAALKAIEKPQAVFYAYLTSGAATFVFGIPLVIHLGLRGAIYGMLLSATAYTLMMFAMWVRSFRQHRGSLPSAHTTLRVAIVEPVWTHYRYPVYCELARHCHVDWVFSPSKREAGFGTVTPAGTTSLRYIEVPTRQPLGKSAGFWQAGVTGYLVRERPDVVMVSADPRSISFWMALVVGRILRIPVYAHGHGVYRKTQISWLYRKMMNLLLRLSAGYIAYAPIVRDTFAAQGFCMDKVRVAHNSMVNPRPLLPNEKTGSEHGVLFLGRLRPDSGIETLLSSVQRLRQDGYEIELHVIGGGEDLLRLQEAYVGLRCVRWYGQVYDPAKIREISRACFVGCHPGHAGLSVVHMMSLSLPVIVPDGFEKHGPEVALVSDGKNGVRCSAAQLGAHLDKTLRALARDSARVREMQHVAYQTYLELTTPSLATRIGQILFQSGYQRSCPEPQDAGIPVLVPTLARDP
jgi:O-antigen/teichoic acid export membrane protein